MDNNFEAALKFIFQSEGGYAKRDNEPGGYVNKGISMQTLCIWRKLSGLPEPTPDDILNLTVEEAEEIYAHQYGGAILFDKLPMGLDYAVLDSAVNEGVGGTIRMLQTILGVPVTGHMDLETLAAIKTHTAWSTVDALAKARLDAKKLRPDWAKFGPGWTNRVLFVVKNARVMMQASPPPVVKPVPVSSPQAPLSFPVVGAVGKWKGVIGVGMTREQMKSYISGLKFPSWKPSFMVLHNTGVPKLADWHKYDGPTRMRGLVNYYKNQENWSGGPHCFVADDLYWPFTPMWVPGTHSPSWNGVSLGIEMVADFATEDDDAGQGLKVKDNAAYLFAMLHDKLGLDPDTIKLHKQDPRTTHDCPGKDVERAEFITRVKKYMNPKSNELGFDEAGEHPTTVPIAPEFTPPLPVEKIGVVKVAVNDVLYLRNMSGTSGAVVASLANGTKLIIKGEAQNAKSLWLNVRVPSLSKEGWVSAAFVSH